VLEDLVCEKEMKPLDRTWGKHELSQGLSITSNWKAYEMCLPRPQETLIETLNVFLKHEDPKDLNALRPAVFLIAAILPNFITDM